MSGHRKRLVAVGVTSLLVAGAGIAAIASTDRTAAATEQASAAIASTATAEVVRRTIQSSDVLDGTLGYTGVYSIRNWLETSNDISIGAASSTTQAYLTARTQYDTAVANRDVLRSPTAADVERAQATLAQARAALKTAQQADDGPTAAQLAAARSTVTQARENLATAVAQRDSAQSALDACPGATETAAPDASPPPAGSCDRDALAAVLRRADGDVRVRQAQLDAAEAALDGLDDTPANAATNIASAQAGVEAAGAALDALLHPTTARLRQADGAVAVAKAQLDEAQRALGRPSGMVTQVAAAGSIVEPGGVLYALDGSHKVVLLAGEMPAWRALDPGAAEGPDIGQLERSLQALGFWVDAVAPDDHWDRDTTEAVQRLQTSLGTDDDGTIDLGEVVFLPGPIRVTEVLADLGSTVRQETRVLTVTSTDRQVTVELEADRQAIVAPDVAVTVELPDGVRTAGTIADIATVATAAAGSTAPAGAVPTITVTIRLNDPGASGLLDGAPVLVSIVRERREDVLAVPVSALLALAEGGYAVEMVDGSAPTHLIGVEIGLFEDGFVEVRSAELREGARVVVPS